MKCGSDGNASDGDTTEPVVESGRNLYVRNISPRVTSEEFCQLFESFGAIESHKLMVDIKTGLPRGFGFILFNKEEEAKAAVRGLDGMVLYEQPLSVRFASTAVRTPGEPTGRLFLRHLPASFTVDDVRALCLPDEPLDVAVYPDGGDLAALAHVTTASPDVARRVARRLNNSTRFLDSEQSPTPADGGSSGATPSASIRTITAAAPRPAPGKAYRPLQVKVLAVGQDFPQPRQPPRSASAAEAGAANHPHGGPGSRHHSTHHHPAATVIQVHPYHPSAQPAHYVLPAGWQFTPAAVPVATGWWPTPSPVFPTVQGVIPVAPTLWQPAFGFAAGGGGQHPQQQWQLNAGPTAYVPFPTLAVYPFPNAPPPPPGEALTPGFQPQPPQP